MKYHSRTVAVALGAVVTIGAIAAPAMAASRTTYISGWREANRSSTWGDDFELRSIWKQNGVRCYCYFYSNPVTISW